MIAVTASISDKAAQVWLDRIAKHEDSFKDLRPYINSPNIGLVAAYQLLYEGARNKDIIAFTHDDWEPHEPWVARVEAEFSDPNVAIVGLGGAKGIGVDDIYRTPYKLQQLQRIDYMSNQTDAEIHGKRFTGACDVAVLDGFFMAVRTSFLDEIGGFKWFPHRFHCYDTALCLMAHRHGYKVRMVGISATHWGGGTSTSADYVQDCKDRGTSVAAEHTEPHRWMYDEFRDLMPLRIR